jgi:hypothetical protein
MIDLWFDEQVSAYDSCGWPLCDPAIVMKSYN